MFVSQQWFTLTDQGEGKPRMARPRSGILSEAATQRMPERQVPFPAFISG